MVLQLHAHQQLAVQQRVYIQGRKTKIKHAAFSVQRKLGQPWLTKVGLGMNEVAERCHLKIPEESNVADFEFLGKDSTRFRNRPLAGDKTTKNYEVHLRQFWRFAAFKGDYESMLMLLKKPPAHCPSMSVNTLEEYMRFKRLEPDEPLLDEHGTPVLDVFGTPITCEGGWIAPKNIKIFRAAIFDLHIANNQTSEEYEEQCEDCRALPDDQRLDGCEHHPHNPSRYRRGNPTRHQTFRNTVITMDQVAVEKGYQETGSSQLLPSDLRLLRGRLLSTNSIVDLRDWVIDILATKQALRHDEFHDIHENHFLPELFEITDDRFQVHAMVSAETSFRPCDDRLVPSSRSSCLLAFDWMERRLHLSLPRGTVESTMRLRLQNTYRLPVFPERPEECVQSNSSDTHTRTEDRLPGLSQNLLRHWRLWTGWRV